MNKLFFTLWKIKSSNCVYIKYVKNVIFNNIVSVLNGGMKGGVVFCGNGLLSLSVLCDGGVERGGGGIILP